MIGDVCKFIEYIHSIEVPDLAKALFLLYFPSEIFLINFIIKS